MYEIYQKQLALAKLMDWYEEQQKSNPMYKTIKPKSAIIRSIVSFEGETIEKKVRRIMQQGEPIGDGDGAPLLYQERNEGVKPEYDIRADRFEIALGEQEHAVKQHIAKREERFKAKNPETGGKQAPPDVNV